MTKIKTKFFQKIFFIKTPNIKNVNLVRLFKLFFLSVSSEGRENPVFKEVVKLGITPLVSSLAILDYANSEEEILGYGISLIILNVGMYIAAPAVLIYKTRKFVKI